jgi:hypothetical protein
MKIFFSNFWKSNEEIFNELFYLWKCLFSFNIEYCENILDADIVLNSVFIQNNINIYKNKKNIFFTGEPLFYENDNFDANLSFHLQDNSVNKNLITCPVQLLITIYKYEIPKSIFFKNKPIRTEIPPKFCCFITKQPKVERMDFFNQLSLYKKVDSLGPCLNNTGILAPFDQDEFEKLVSQYKFIITFENSQKDVYITEKILHGYNSVILPIYWGSKFICEFFNPESFIYIEEYNQKNIDIAIEKIKLLDNDDFLYLNMINQPVFNKNFDIDKYFENIKLKIKEKLKL